MAFNLDEISRVPEMCQELMEKYVNTNNEILIMVCEQNQREMLNKHPHTLIVDGTHKTSSSGYILVSILIIGELYKKSHSITLL